MILTIVKQTLFHALQRSAFAETSHVQGPNGSETAQAKGELPAFTNSRTPSMSIGSRSTAHPWAHRERASDRPVNPPRM
jgi:hypothetical protein